MVPEICITCEVIPLEFPNVQNQAGYQNNFHDVFLHCVSRSAS